MGGAGTVCLDRPGREKIGDSREERSYEITADAAHRGRDRRRGR
jgi:hypothetical protein